MPLFRSLLSISACGLLAGCMAAPYLEPEGPGLATLVIDNESIDPLEAATYVSGDTCSAKRSLHPGIPLGGPHIVKVSGGKPFTLWTKSVRAFTSHNEPIGRLTGVGICSGSLTFTPLPGRRYVARFRMEPDKDGLQRSSGSCYAQVAEEIRLPNGSLRRTAQPYRWRTESACQ